MTTIIERRTAAPEGESISSVLVAVIAIVVIIGFALFAFRLLPLQNNTATPGTIDVNVEGQLPTGTNP